MNADFGNQKLVDQKIGRPNIVNCINPQKKINGEMTYR